MEDLKFKTAKEVAMNVDPDFTCANNSNFQLNVNGFRISVAFGPGMYVENDIRYSKEDPRDQYVWGSKFAEVKIWDRNGNSMFESVPMDELNRTVEDVWKLEAQGGHNDQVFGWCSSDCVARMIGCLASCPPHEDPRRALVQIEEASR